MVGERETDTGIYGDPDRYICAVDAIFFRIDSIVIIELEGGMWICVFECDGGDYICSEIFVRVCHN